MNHVLARPASVGLGHVCLEALEPEEQFEILAPKQQRKNEQGTEKVYPELI